MRLVSPVEGRFQRWGKWAEYDNWLENTAPAALPRSAARPRSRRSAWARRSRCPVDVHNWSDDAAERHGQPDAAGRLHRRRDVEAVRAARRRAPTRRSTSPSRTVHERDAADDGHAATAERQRQRAHHDDLRRAGTGLRGPDARRSCPKTTIPQAPAAPTLDGVEGAGEYTGEALDIGRKWEPAAQLRLRAGSASTAAPSGAVGGADEHLRQGHLLAATTCTSSSTSRDDFQTYAVKPDECVAHWLADSVEILIDPRGNASQVLKDTANTFKLGIFPFTNDPTNSNGNGANGPCWSRDADNHQGFSTGPLAATVDDAPNAPGVQSSSRRRRGSASTTTTRRPLLRRGGGYNLEVKIPMAILPAAIDPNNMGLNITPYDEDNTAAAGTTTLRHIDQSTRLAWSTFGSVQSDPYRWGHATLPGYTPPAGRPTTPRDAERVAPEPRRRRLAADDRPVGPQRRADLRSRAGAGQPRHHGQRREC